MMRRLCVIAVLPPRPAPGSRVMLLFEEVIRPRGVTRRTPLPPPAPAVKHCQPPLKLFKGFILLGAFPPLPRPAPDGAQQ